MESSSSTSSQYKKYANDEVTLEEEVFSSSSAPATATDDDDDDDDDVEDDNDVNVSENSIPIDFSHDYMSLHVQTVSQQPNEPEQKHDESPIKESITSSNSNNVGVPVAKRPKNNVEEAVDDYTSPTKRARLMMTMTMSASSPAEAETKTDTTDIINKNNNNYYDNSAAASEDEDDEGVNEQQANDTHAAITLLRSGNPNHNNQSKFKYPPGITHVEKARIRAKKSYHRKMTRLKELPIEVQQQKRLDYNAARKAKAEKKRELQIGFLIEQIEIESDNKKSLGYPIENDNNHVGDGNGNCYGGNDNGNDDVHTWKCRGCSKTYGSEIGLIQHIKRTCKVYKKWKQTKRIIDTTTYNAADSSAAAAAANADDGTASASIASAAGTTTTATNDDNNDGCSNMNWQQFEQIFQHQHNNHNQNQVDANDEIMSTTTPNIVSAAFLSLDYISIRQQMLVAAVASASNQNQNQHHMNTTISNFTNTVRSGGAGAALVGRGINNGNNMVYLNHHYLTHSNNNYHINNYNTATAAAAAARYLQQQQQHQQFQRHQYHRHQHQLQQRVMDRLQILVLLQQQQQQQQQQAKDYMSLEVTTIPPPP
jgi:hypothetical protein